MADEKFVEILQLLVPVECGHLFGKCCLSTFRSNWLWYNIPRRWDSFIIVLTSDRLTLVPACVVRGALPRPEAPGRH